MHLFYAIAISTRAVERDICIGQGLALGKFKDLICGPCELAR